MSDITKISILQNAEQETVDTTTARVVTDSVVVGGQGGTELTKTVLDALIAGGSNTGEKTDPFTLSSQDEANKSVTLTGHPAIAANTILLVDGSPTLTYGTDYTVMDNVLSWSGLGLDGILNAGDKIVVLYSV